MTISRPILLALLAMNGILVLAVLAIGGFLLCGRGRAGKARRMGPGYRNVGASGSSAPYSDEGNYYDPPKRS